MSGIGGVSAANHVSGPAASGAGAGAADAPALLPDAMTELYLGMAEMRDAQVGQSKNRVDAAKAQREAAMEAQKKALERAKEAAEDGGFLDWIAKDVGLGSAVGLVSFNYVLVAADLAIHKLGLLEKLQIDEKIDVVDVAAAATGRWEVLAADVLLRKTELTPKEARDLVERCGIPKDAPGISDEDLQPIAKKLVIANLIVASLAATVLSCGTTGSLCVAVAGVALSYGGTAVAQEKALDGVFGEGSSRWIGLGIQLYGTAASCMSGLGGGGALLSSAGVGATASRGAAVATGMTSAVMGTDQVVTAVHEHTRARAEIDAENARFQLARLDRLLDTIIESIEDTHGSHRKATQALQGAIDTANQTNVAMAQGMRV